MKQPSKNKISIKIKGGYIPTVQENIHQHLQEINRGVGSPKPKKGKGSYRRKPKHNNNEQDTQ